MTTLSFTTYIDAPASEVVRRISAVAPVAPHGTVVKVLPFVDRSKVVVRIPWNAVSEVERSADTLAATRFVRAVDLAALAA